ncbi:hypothetical protein FA95DRAFT_1600216 [Auriscalpium vulgare]|uniref:Uncharacterized protein n=1 Tax=Auriscalpium vulgare TaxID=40419 RepID=A0ACB8R289_9AGAM|nr:hypothetical protein FA95DRAFT_1600216 [Auriscalpium vulgare]
MLSSLCPSLSLRLFNIAPFMSRPASLTLLITDDDSVDGGLDERVKELYGDDGVTCKWYRDPQDGDQGSHRVYVYLEDEKIAAGSGDTLLMAKIEASMRAIVAVRRKQNLLGKRETAGRPTDRRVQHPAGTDHATQSSAATNLGRHWHSAPSGHGAPTSYPMHPRLDQASCMTYPRHGASMPYPTYPRLNQAPHVPYSGNAAPMLPGPYVPPPAGISAPTSFYPVAQIPAQHGMHSGYVAPPSNPMYRFAAENNPSGSQSTDPHPYLSGSSAVASFEPKTAATRSCPSEDVNRWFQKKPGA